MMNLRLLPALAMISASTMLMSCDSDEAPVIPEASSRMTRTFSFTNPASVEEIKYTRDSLETMALLDEEELFILVNTQGSTDSDEISFTLDKNVLEQPLKDTYTINTLQQSGDVEVIYTYDMPAQSGSIYFSSVDQMVGQFKITEYDATNKLISGYYDVTIPDVYDPKATTPTSNRRADIRLKGEFKKIKLIR